MTFLIGHFSWGNLLGERTEEEKKQIEKALIGTCVIKPVSDGVVGRTLLNPQYFVPERSVYIRC